MVELIAGLGTTNQDPWLKPPIGMRFDDVDHSDPLHHSVRYTVSTCVASRIEMRRNRRRACGRVGPPAGPLRRMLG
jgi:hypothetical protein